MRGVRATAIAGISMMVLMVVPWSTTAAAPAGRHGGTDPAERTDELAITAVSPWVGPDGTFTISFSTAGMPPDAVVTTTIRQRLRPRGDTLRDALETQLDDGTPPRNLQAPMVTPLARLPNRNGTATIEIPVRSGAGDTERQLIPTPGIHPVTIEVAPSGTTGISTATVFLNRLPEEPQTGRDGRPARTAVQLLAALDSAPALGVDGRSALSIDESLAVSSWESMLTENRDLPLTVALRPNTILGLQRSEVPADRAFVEDLAGTAFTVAAQSYVKVDTAALARSDSTVLDQQLATGSSILDSVTGHRPGDIWMFDDTVDPSAARRLARAGITHLFVSEDRLALQSDAQSDDADSDDADMPARTRTFALDGVDGMTVTSYDAEVTRLLLDPDLSPGLRAHRSATAVMASWFDAVRSGPSAFPGVSAAIVLAPGVDHETLAAFVSALAPDTAADGFQAPAPLQISPPTAATADDRGDPVSARLRRRHPDDQDAVVRSWRDTATRIAGFASMTGPEDPMIREWTLLNDQTLALASDTAARNATWGHIGRSIDERLAMIQSPPPRSVVLTSRSRSIPLRLRNRGDTAVTVRMTTRSPRLEFPAGATRDVRLEPGENRVDIPVEVRAPGSSLLRIDLRSPDGALEIREVQVTVRSWSISGVGAALSIASLAVLAVWWIRTLRRRRRPEQAGSDPHTERGHDHG